MAQTAMTSARPGGRSARVRDDVHAAVGRLIGRGQRDSLTIPQIAREAGVNPTSVYRRWGTVDQLCAEVAVAVLTEDHELPDTGSLRGDLAAWGESIARDVERRAVYLRALAASRTGWLASCPCWEQRVTQAELMTARARQRDEPAPSARQVTDHLVAPLYHHAVFALPGGPEYARSLVEDLLAIAGGAGDTLPAGSAVRA
jgi:AcrR family transcriptional regulator